MSALDPTEAQAENWRRHLSFEPEEARALGLEIDGRKSLARLGEQVDLYREYATAPVEQVGPAPQRCARVAVRRFDRGDAQIELERIMFARRAGVVDVDGYLREFIALLRGGIERGRVPPLELIERADLRWTRYPSSPAQLGTALRLERSAPGPRRRRAALVSARADDLLASGWVANVRAPSKQPDSLSGMTAATRLRLATIPLLALALACDRGESSSSSASADAPAKAEASEPAAESKADEPEPAAPSEPETVSAKPEAAPAPAKLDLANAALFMVRDKGLIALTETGFTTIPGSERMYVAGFVHGADGVVYAMTASNIERVEGDGMPEVAKLDYGTLGSVADFDVGSQAQIWVIGTKGLAEFRDGSWTSYAKAEVGLSEDFAVGIAIDQNGDPWAATSDSLVRRTPAGAWEPAELPKGRTKFLNKMGRGPDGEVYLSTYDRLLRLTGDPGLVKIKKGRYESPGAFAFAESTYGAIISGLEDVSIFLPEDQAVRYVGKKDLGIGTVSAVAVDSSGRVWAAGDAGVAIVGPGDARVTWRSGSMEEVAGQISNLIVRGEGPPLPEAGEIKKGGLSGQIIEGDEGVAKVKVELCESPDMLYSRTPCTGAPTHLEGTTDEDGRFRFDDVPLGAYGLAVKDGNKWKISLGAALGTQMKEGEVYDIGQMSID